MKSIEKKIKSVELLVILQYNAARLYSRTGDVAACLTHLDQVLEIAPQWADDAAKDEHLSWALEMRSLRLGDNAQENDGQPD